MSEYIRKANQSIPLTAKQTMEMARLMKRPTGVRRFVHYVDINTASGPINFGKVIKDFQYDMIDLFQQNDRSILLASRQMSKCVTGNTMIKIRNNKTNEEMDISIEEFHESQKQLINSKECNKIQDNGNEKKFIEQLPVSDWLVMTDTGYEKLNGSNKTVNYTVWEIETETHTLRCADNHIVFDTGYNEVFVKDLKIGYVIMTEKGAEKVISVKETNAKEPMYDLSVDSTNHRYYTNGILSHNTTIGAFYLLYEACFPESKGDILIVAHKQGHAMEVLKRLKDMYYSMPMWMKPGVIKNNETSVEFDNGMRVIAEATTANAARGKSLKFVYCDEIAFIPNRVQEEFMAGTAPALSATQGKMMITSTPNGSRDLFAKLWFGTGMEWDRREHTYVRKRAKKNLFTPLFVPYWIDETKNNDEWIQREKQTLADATKWKVEFECLGFDTEVEVYDEIEDEYKTITLDEMYKILLKDEIDAEVIIKN